MIASLAVLAGAITDRLLHLHGWAALAIVFAIPALEASAFVGFLFPGEIAVLLGGVLAYEHRVALAAVIGAAVAGAVLGDTAGYFIGKRWGRAILHHTFGRVPIVQRHLERSLEKARGYVRRRRGRAVFFGRFTTALRVLIPGLAGMSDIHFPTFLAYNVAGGTLWATGFVLLGFFAGAGWRRVESVAKWLGLGLLGVAVLALVITRLSRESRRLHAVGDRLAATRPLAWIRRTFPDQVAWLRRRMDPGRPAGFPLTFTVAAGAFSGWAFGGLTQDVIAHDEAARFDPRVLAFAVGHRAGWLTPIMRTLTVVGSNEVLIPVGMVVAVAFLVRRREWRPFVRLATALAGAVAAYDIVKPLVHRARPPVSDWIGGASGWSFPSGHATQCVAFLGMLALVWSTGRGWRVRALLWTAAAMLSLAVGGSRIYLGVHWLTDVLAGYALGATWLAVVVVVGLLAAARAERKGIVAGDRA